MQNVSINLPDELVFRFDQICLENNQIRQNVLQELMTRYLEDIEDSNEAMRVIERNEPTTSINNLRIELGLEN